MDPLQGVKPSFACPKLASAFEGSISREEWITNCKNRRSNRGEDVETVTQQCAEQYQRIRDMSDDDFINLCRKRAAPLFGASERNPSPRLGSPKALSPRHHEKKSPRTSGRTEQFSGASAKSSPVRNSPVRSSRSPAKRSSSPQNRRSPQNARSKGRASPSQDVYSGDTITQKQKVLSEFSKTRARDSRGRFI